MFILSAALERTGTIEVLGHWFEKLAGRSERRVLVMLVLLVAPLSAAVNNTPVVVVFLPIVLALARRHHLRASKLLIPLSYAAIVGGTCTVIGTSTNVLATQLAQENGLPPFGMFEPLKLGIIFVGITFAYLVLFGNKALPERTTLATLFEAEEGKEYLTEGVIEEGSPLAGKKFTDTPLAKLRDVRVIDVVRNGHTVKKRLDKIVFEAGDLVLLKSRAGGLMELHQSKGIELTGGAEQGDGSGNAEVDLGLTPLKTESAVLMEGIIGPKSSLVGRTLRSLNFRQRFGAIILAVHRRGENLRERFQDVELAFGDTLLVEGPAERMNELFAERDFLNLSRPQHRPFRRSKAPIAIGAILLFMALAALFVRDESVSLAGIALGGAFLVLATRCVEPREAYEAVDWRVIFMIFGMIGLGKGLEVSGAAHWIAMETYQVFGRFGPHAVVAVIYLLAALMTEMISNNAVATLLTPIAVGIGIAMEVNPAPFVVAVMFGSSASFSTPIGYQTNTYVFGAGGYKFTDFCRAGVPLAVLLWIAASLLIPVLWSF
ncbi:MAG: SLC13 family permease [Verrucomicrobiales bacterium]